MLVGAWIRTFDIVRKFHIGIIRVLERSVDKVHDVRVFVIGVVVKPWCIVFEAVWRRII